MTEREKFINSIFAEESSSLKEWIEQVKVDLDKLIEGEVKWRKERSIDQVKIVEYLVNQIVDLRDACHQKQEIIDGQKDYAKISLELERLKEEKEQPYEPWWSVRSKLRAAMKMAMGFEAELLKLKEEVKSMFMLVDDKYGADFCYIYRDDVIHSPMDYPEIIKLLDK